MMLSNQIIEIDELQLLVSLAMIGVSGQPVRPEPISLAQLALVWILVSLPEETVNK